MSGYAYKIQMLIEELQQLNFSNRSIINTFSENLNKREFNEEWSSFLNDLLVTLFDANYEETRINRLCALITDLSNIPEHSELPCEQEMNVLLVLLTQTDEPMSPNSPCVPCIAPEVEAPILELEVATWGLTDFRLVNYPSTKEEALQELTEVPLFAHNRHSPAPSVSVYDEPRYKNTYSWWDRQKPKGIIDYLDELSNDQDFKVLHSDAGKLKSQDRKERIDWLSDVMGRTISYISFTPTECRHNNPTYEALISLHDAVERFCRDHGYKLHIPQAAGQSAPEMEYMEKVTHFCRTMKTLMANEEVFRTRYSSMVTSLTRELDNFNDEAPYNVTKAWNKLNVALKDSKQVIRNPTSLFKLSTEDQESIALLKDVIKRFSAEIKNFIHRAPHTEQQPAHEFQPTHDFNEDFDWNRAALL